MIFYFIFEIFREIFCKLKKLLYRCFYRNLEKDFWFSIVYFKIKTKTCISWKDGWIGIYSPFLSKKFWISMFFHILHSLDENLHFWIQIVFFLNKTKLISLIEKYVNWKYVDLIQWNNFAFWCFFVSRICWLIIESFITSSIF